MNIAFFDLDKTILNRDSIVAFVFFYLRKKPLKIFAFISLIPSFILFYCKLMSNDKIKYKLCKIFKGLSIEEGDRIGKEFADTIIPNFYYEDALAEIKKIKNKGYSLYLVTASFELYAKFIAGNLGFDRCMGSELWTFRNVYTGYLYGKNCYGEAKKHRLCTDSIFPRYQEYCITYSDSISDMPLFSYSSIKICVNPDEKLREYAINNSKEGFKIVNWR